MIVGEAPASYSRNSSLEVQPSSVLHVVAALSLTVPRCSSPFTNPASFPSVPWKVAHVCFTRVLFPEAHRQWLTAEMGMSKTWAHILSIWVSQRACLCRRSPSRTASNNCTPSHLSRPQSQILSSLSSLCSLFPASLQFGFDGLSYKLYLILTLA